MRGCEAVARAHSQRFVPEPDSGTAQTPRLTSLHFHFTWWKPGQGSAVGALPVPLFLSEMRRERQVRAEWGEQGSRRDPPSHRAGPLALAD